MEVETRDVKREVTRGADHLAQAIEIALELITDHDVAEAGQFEHLIGDHDNRLGCLNQVLRQVGSIKDREALGMRLDVPAENKPQGHAERSAGWCQHYFPPCFTTQEPAWRLSCVQGLA